MEEEADVARSPFYRGKPGACLECSDKRDRSACLYIECGQERLYGPLCERHANTELYLQAGELEP